MKLMCFGLLLLFVSMHKFTHVWPVKTYWLLSPIDTILLDFDSYLAVWQDKIFQVYLLYFLLNYKNLRGKCKHFKTTFLTQNGKVEFHWFLMVNPLRRWFWIWICTTQKHGYLGPLPPSLTRCHNLVWVTLPALGHAISAPGNYFLTWDSPAKTSSFKKKGFIIHSLPYKWPKLQMTLPLF